MPSAATPALSPLCAILAFDASNRLAVRKLGSKLGLAFTGTDLAMATARLASAFGTHTAPVEYFSSAAGDQNYRVFFTQVSSAPPDGEIELWSLEKLETSFAVLAPLLATLIGKLDPFLVEIPYLHLGENDFIYKFRPAQERNSAIYAQDSAASTL